MMTPVGVEHQEGFSRFGWTFDGPHRQPLGNKNRGPVKVEVAQVNAPFHRVTVTVSGRRRGGQRGTGETDRVIVRLAGEGDFPGFLGLAAQVECWFGPMVEDPGFHDTVRKHMRRSTAIVAVSSGPDLLGGLLFAVKAPAYHVRWLVVSERSRGTGVGRALMAEAMCRFVRGPGTVEVVTFGADHPGASVSGARVFYERLGFVPAEVVDPGPEGGSRQVFRLTACSTA
jgi:GNAT superfamily N-acetyltransferase